jgi:hypothetical protein
MLCGSHKEKLPKPDNPCPERTGATLALTAVPVPCYKERVPSGSKSDARTVSGTATEGGRQKMSGKSSRWLILVLGSALATGLSLVGLAAAVNPNEHTVKPERNVQDSDDLTEPNSKLWALDFTFRGPRIIKVDVPGRGQKVCWYLWYQVVNNTKEPHTFIPDFQLVTHDRHTIHHDQVLPHVEEAIRKLEDPTDYWKVKNSVTISAEPIPPTRPNAVPRPVTGVAIWDDVDPDSNHYSIFVLGLSNGWSLSDPIEKGGAPVVRRKTLQLNFHRRGDRFYQKSEEIRFDEKQGAEWIYRGSELKIPGLTPEAPAPKKD